MILYKAAKSEPKQQTFIIPWTFCISYSAEMNVSESLKYHFQHGQKRNWKKTKFILNMYSNLTSNLEPFNVIHIKSSNKLQ